MDPEDPDSDPIVRASERNEAGDYAGDGKFLMDLLEKDLRCLDAHAHLGNFAFERWPKDALRHYEAGVCIGELSFGISFAGVLPWSFIDNRPLLRCLKGFGLCLWRLGRLEEAAAIFERLLRYNPDDNQGAQFLLTAVLAGEPWVARTPLSYVEPGEAAWEILAEIVKPCIDEMKRLIDLGLEAKALETCKGTMLGLYRFEQSGQGLVDWAPDYPAQAACDVAKVWVTGEMEEAPPPGARGRRKLAEFPRKFLDDFVADWKAMLSRQLYPDKEGRGKSPSR